MKTFIAFFACIILMINACSSENSNNDSPNQIKEDTIMNKRTIHINTNDGIQLTADIYEINDTTSPIILLFHQARFSRGEYIETAPKLNELGFTCIAIDQRSGDEVNGIENETVKQAKEKGFGTEFPDAYTDLETTLLYAKGHFPNRKIIVWGSSYSASLIFILASQHPDIVKGLIAFSPGEYFKYEGHKTEYYARLIKCPVFITSAKNEFGKWNATYEAVPGKMKSYFLPGSDGYHGSKALWKENDGYQAYWDALKVFLKNMKTE